MIVDVDNRVQVIPLETGDSGIRRGLMALALILGLALMASGCGTQNTDLVSQGRMRVTAQPSSKIYVPWASVKEAERGFVVYGALRRRDTVGLAIWTHVDVTVLDATGRTANRAYSRQVAVPRRSIGHLGHVTRFRVAFEEAPPEQGTVQVAVCFDNHEPSPE